ncbi:MAG: tRNA epoxyqueuosine(34) reductase QueG [Verrucomicrobiaceae bacterium]|nr:MAG: tRNA epoxyqueuosine(34) reductase QueG [Verrucomicrobiaceae bacterium]
MIEQMTREKLESISHEAGFDAVGVTLAVRAPHAEVFLDWVGEGCHATMDWLARDPERRCNPRLVLPGARSVIALAMNYYHPDEPVADGAARGRIARYARGRDYHHLIRKRLREFDRALAEEGGQQKCFVDTGPILERDFSALAGISWHGKSTLALHPQLGTWFFLAAVITTIELEEPGSPMPARCGKCTRCIDVCPTNAIVAPYKMDARRCISYWTIEHEGPLPKWIRPLLGDRIFGCDDCLDACPWNRFAKISREADFSARKSSQLSLQEYLALDEQAFRKLFEGSPVRRAGRQGFLRNVCTALGNIGTSADLPALENTRLDDDPVISEHAAWAVGQISSRGK